MNEWDIACEPHMLKRGCFAQAKLVGGLADGVTFSGKVPEDTTRLYVEPDNKLLRPYYDKDNPSLCNNPKIIPGHYKVKVYSKFPINDAEFTWIEDK